MPPHLLLLLTLGSTLPLWENADAAAPAPLPARGRRQASLPDFDDEDYSLEATDPPETLHNHSSGAAADPQLLTTLGTLGLRASAGPGTPEPTTGEAATGPFAGLGAGGTAAGEQSTGLATPRMPGTVKLATEPTSVTAPIMEAPATEGALPLEAVSSKDLSTGPAVTEAETTPPASTRAETTPPVTTDAETTPPVTTKAATSPTPVATAAVSTEPFPTKPLSRETPTPTFPVTYKGAIATTSDVPKSTLKSSEVVLPGSSAAPSPTGASDLIPVKQCLLAILVLALVATVFLVCTVVLAVRLSRKTHMYPVRNYSPTEMVCISALLPDAGEGAPAAANGGLPKGHGLKAEAGEDREGDDLTLRSFLP